jgi:tRNA(Ile)-lysidine synthase
VGPDPAVAAVRLAVRRCLAQAPGAPQAGSVLVACSGGADSLALLAGTVFELRRSETRVVAAVVDHGLQAGSDDRTAHVVEQMAQVGADETASVRVTVDPGPRGIEAGAREARYVALSQLAQHVGASLVLLGHTLDDQAETVLLGLTQGSGPRSLSGIRRSLQLEAEGPTFLRPLLDLTRDQTQAACRAEEIDWWDDPHNADPRFVRARVRHTVLPVLERELGPGVARALARTGHLVRHDVDALDDLALGEGQRHDVRRGVDVGELVLLPAAVRTRLLRGAALEAGSPPRELSAEHVQAIDDLVTRPRGEARELELPGRVRAVRRGDELRLEARGDDDVPPVAG